MKQPTTTKTESTLYAVYESFNKPPRVEAYRAVTTAKRVALHSRHVGVMHFDPEQVPRHYADTVHGAWVRFSEAQQLKLKRQLAEVRETEERIALAETQLTKGQE